ncbi:hypothetical protein HPB47_020742 [Ixodes persulcatus]|uniref:Uncharacterized protein n=1 Tax=Ixodes persulcatus TaxID=34615 RepID=A0AC60QI34_IXOPE|nr:hypothetical protein HPB47_020742 [Ixodes persulcatus]
MEDHPQWARACTELTVEFTRDRRTLLWVELVRRLNSQGPANKTLAEWQRFLGAKARVAKGKAGILSEDGRGTGGGPPRGSPLISEEEQNLGILGVSTVHVCGGPVLGLVATNEQVRVGTQEMGLLSLIAFLAVHAQEGATDD